MLQEQSQKGKPVNTSPWRTMELEVVPWTPARCKEFSWPPLLPTQHVTRPSPRVQEKRDFLSKETEKAVLRNQDTAGRACMVVRVGCSGKCESEKGEVRESQHLSPTWFPQHLHQERVPRNKSGRFYSGESNLPMGKASRWPMGVLQLNRCGFWFTWQWDQLADKPRPPSEYVSSAP